MNIDLWVLELTGLSQRNAAELQRDLSKDELERTAGYLFEPDRGRFAVGRGILRHILANYTGLRPERIRFTYSPSGKPVLQEQKLHFSVSHAGTLYAVAVSLSCAVGLDLERVSTFPVTDDLLHRVCTRQERYDLEQLPAPARRVRFLGLWTLKESYLKAIGTGLLFSPNRIAAAPKSLNEESSISKLCLDGRILSGWTAVGFEPPCAQRTVGTLVAQTDLPLEIIYRNPGELFSAQ